LVDVGMLDRQGTAYSVPDDAVEIADRLAAERGGAESRGDISIEVGVIDSPFR
jgi:hypothetical protein